MSIFSTIRRALGFPGSEDAPDSHGHGGYDDDDDDNVSATGYVRPQPSAAPVRQPAQGAEPQEDAGGTLGARLSKVTAERDTARQELLSAERRKQALTDRVYDLEKRLSALEAEKEKLYTENRRLEVQVKTRPGRMPVIAPGDTVAQSLKKALEEEQKLTDTLRRDLETASVKLQMAETMVKDLTSQASTANREADEAKRDYKAAMEDRERLRKRLAEAETELDDAARAVEKIGHLEDYKKNCDMRVAEVQRTVSLRDKEIRSLNATIEHNLKRHAEAMALLQREIEALRAGRPEPRQPDVADAAMADAEPVEPREKRQRSRQQRQAPAAEPDSQPTLF